MNKEGDIMKGKIRTLLTAGILTAGMLAALPVSAANLNFGASNTPTNIAYVSADDGQVQTLFDTTGVPQDWDMMLADNKLEDCIRFNCYYRRYDGQLDVADDLGFFTFTVKNGLVRKADLRYDQTAGASGDWASETTYKYNRKNCLLKSHDQINISSRTANR